MNKEIERQLAKMLEQALQVAEKTGEFVIEQAPLILKEFYVWHTTSHALSILLGIALILIGRYTPYMWLEKERGSWDTRYFKRFGYQGSGVAYFFFITFSIFGVDMVISHTFKLIKILVSPKLYLIEYFL